MAKIAVNTTISAVAASITAIAFGLYYERKLCPTDASNGILSGTSLIVTPRNTFDRVYFIS